MPAAAKAVALVNAVQKPKRQRDCDTEVEAIPRPVRPCVDPSQFDYLQLEAIVISLARRPDRMQACTTRLQERCPWLKAAYFEATDGKTTPIKQAEVALSWDTARNVVYQRKRSIRKNWDDLHTYHERRLPLSPGERGCASSHVRAWQHCLDRAGDTNRPLLVLEDDAAPTAEFTQVLAKAWSALPADADLLYLGYSQAAEWRREVSPELVESEYVWTTVAYVVWPAAARRMLSRLPVNEPVDNWMAAQAAEKHLNAYCVRPKIVLQADAWNVNSDVVHSDENYWGPCSDIQHSDATAEAAVQENTAETWEGPRIFGVDGSDSEDSNEEK